MIIFSGICCVVTVIFGMAFCIGSFRGGCDTSQLLIGIILIAVGVCGMIGLR